MAEPKRLLIVEDEVISALCLMQELKKLDYVISGCVTSGEMAIDSMARNPPDVVLMDIQLSGQLNGLETVTLMRSSCAVPVIFMTGYGDTEIQERANMLDPAGFLRKPFAVSALKAILDGL